MVRREIAPTSQALQVAFSRLFREPMLSESTSFGSRWGIYEMGSSRSVLGSSYPGSCIEPTRWARQAAYPSSWPRSQDHYILERWIDMRSAASEHRIQSAHKESWPDPHALEALSSRPLF